MTVGLTVAGLALATLGAVQRSKVWRSDLALWTDTVERAPDAGLAWSELGRAYLERGTDLHRALACYQRAIAAANDPYGRAVAYNSIGVIQVRLGRQQAALDAWRAAVVEQPDYALGHYNLGNLLASRYEATAREQGRTDHELLSEACAVLRRSVDLDPRYRKGWLRLVWCDVQEALRLASSAGDHSAALVALQEAEAKLHQLRGLDREGGFVEEAARLIRLGRDAVDLR